MFTIVSAIELEPLGVTVNAVAPVARTRMNVATDGVPPAAPGEFDSYATENSSPIVAYLASEQAGWITGQIIRVDGNKLRFYKRWDTSEQAFHLDQKRALRADEVDLGLKALYGVRPLALKDRRLRAWQ
jgi:hypothetical protein